jgi:hypothetical protein
MKLFSAILALSLLEVTLADHGGLRRLQGGGDDGDPQIKKIVI